MRKGWCGMNIFKQKCSHDFKITERSNVLQLDSMGYPLRLVIWKCKKCGKSEQVWIDVPKEELTELDNGKSFLIKWT